jgi:hypothetical protein
LRHEVSEPIGLGRSFHRERSRWKEPRLEATRLGSRPLARDLSAGSRAVPKGSARVAIRSSQGPHVLPVGSRASGPSTEDIGRAREQLCQRATAGRVLRGSDGRGRARGSTSIAEVDRRRLAPLAHVRRAVDHEYGSSPSARERARGRTSVGSRIDRGEAARSVAGSWTCRDRESVPRQIPVGSAKASLGSPCRERESVSDRERASLTHSPREHLSMEGVLGRESQSP